MAQSTNPILLGFSGKLGNAVVFRRVGRKIVMARVPDRWRKEPVGKQIGTCDEFKFASKWAKKTLENPEMLAAYREKAGNGRSAYNVAIKDYLTSPVVSDIDVSKYHGHAGDRITVTAKKDFRVKEVTVSIIGPGGVELEHGTCTPGVSWKQWHYTASAEAGNPAGLMVTAVAKDYPGK